MKYEEIIQRTIKKLEEIGIDEPFGFAELKQGLRIALNMRDDNAD